MLDTPLEVLILDPKKTKTEFPIIHNLKTILINKLIDMDISEALTNHAILEKIIAAEASKEKELLMTKDDHEIMLGMTKRWKRWSFDVITFMKARILHCEEIDVDVNKAKKTVTKA